ncbi:hypothetical protein C8R45DRAFT_1086686 [Mycena sanguinolenta]|nr:hypothetical protein C8R45DRAFT_1086686 [Mycena sanguinolenta]
MPGFLYQQVQGLPCFVEVDQWKTLTEGQRANAQKLLKVILALDETKAKPADNRDCVKFGSIDLSSGDSNSVSATDNGEQESAPEEGSENESNLAVLKSEDDLSAVEARLDFVIMNSIVDDSDEEDGDDDHEEGRPRTLQEDYDMLQWGLQTAVKENNVDEALVELGRVFNKTAEQLGSNLRLDLDVPITVHNMSKASANKDKAAGEDEQEVSNTASDNSEDKAAGEEDGKNSLPQEMAELQLAGKKILDILQKQVASWPADRQVNDIERRLDGPAERAGNDLDVPISASNATSDGNAEEKATGEEDKQDPPAQDKSESELAADFALANLILKCFFPFFQWLMRTAGEENCVNEELLYIGSHINAVAERVGFELRLDMDDLSKNDPGEIRGFDGDDSEGPEFYAKIQDMSDEDMDKYTLQFDALRQEMEMCTTGRQWKDITRRMNELYEEVGSSTRFDLDNIDENKVLDKPLGPRRR